MYAGVRWRAVVLGVVATLITACSGGDDNAGPTATLGSASPSSTTDPYAIPAVIDEAYVNRVLQGLDQAVGDVTRMVYSSRTITPEAVDRLKALYKGQELLQLNLDIYQRDLRDGFHNYRDVPGNQRTAVTRMITTDPACVFAEVSRDYSAVAVTPKPEPSRLWVALRPMDPAADLGDYNPTPWMYVYDGFQRDRSQPPDPCAS